MRAQNNMYNSEETLENPILNIEMEMTTEPMEERIEATYVYKAKPIYETCKRVMDFIMALLAIIVLSPVFLIVGIAIKCQDGGPILFRQRRVTKRGKEFTMLKFRSMAVNAEEQLEELQNQNEMDGPVFKIKDDPRITKLGRLLRKTSLDELPQLFNILTGSMSFVGPRPPLPEEVAQYNDYQRHRLDVKGGLTCYWQCSGRSNIGFAQWVEMDLKYIRERGFWTDIKILFATVRAVIRMDGAE